MSSAGDANLHLTASADGNSWVDVAVRTVERNQWNERLDPKTDRRRATWMDEGGTLLKDAVRELREGK